MSSPEYPPPPPPPPPPKPKNAHKTFVVGLLLVLVIVSAAVLVYLAIGNSGGFSLNDNSSPTPSASTLPTPTFHTTTPTATGTPPSGTLKPSTSPSSTPHPTPTPSSQTINMENAQSLQFTVTCKVQGVGGQELYTYTFTVKNIGAANMMMRIEGRFFQTQAFFNKTYIVNGAQKNAWIFEGGEWTDVSDEYSAQWNTWNTAWQSYWENLVEWDGLGDITYTTQDAKTVHIYNISVNPILSDALFQP